MDLRSYFGPLRRKFPLILLVGILAGASAWFLSFYRGATTYSGELYVTIAYSDNQETAEYKYGNYYANWASIEFARTVSGWLQSARVVDQIYADARVDMRTDVNFLGKLFGPISMKRVERANLLMSFRSTSRENAERLVAALRDNLSKQITAYNTASATRYSAVNPQARIESRPPDPTLATVLGLIAGLVLGVLLAYIVEYAGGTIVATEQVRDALGKDATFVLRRKDPTLAEVLAAQLAQMPEGSTLLGVSLDPSQLAVRIAQQLRHHGGKVTLVEGEPGMQLSRRVRRGTGWSDEQPAKGAWKIPSKLLRPLNADVVVAPYGRSPRGSLARALTGVSGHALGVAMFPSAARQLVDLPAHTGLLIVAQLGRTRQRDLRHLRSFLGDRSYALVLLS